MLIKPYSIQAQKEFISRNTETKKITWEDEREILEQSRNIWEEEKEKCLEITLIVFPGPVGLALVMKQSLLFETTG